jgi:cellulose synthase/poly-beta-1,6-N-acetylglucosamine synthase-like glycosyltransferase
MLAGALIACIKYIKRVKYLPFKDFEHSTETPPISVLIAARNEENTILNCVQSALSLDYPLFEVIVINDGSDDKTLELLIKNFNLRKVELIYRSILKTENVKGFYYNPEIKNLVVIDKEKGGKADALNCGINMSHYPYFCSVDADSILEKDALIRLITPIMMSTTPVIACSGVVRIGSKKSSNTIYLTKNKLVIFQIIEYIRAFLFGRVGLDLINGLLILSGTFSLINKSAALAVGGYSRKNITEDMEIIVKLHKYYRDNKKTYKIRFIPDPICWTEAPGNLKNLARQRIRWHIGMIQTLYQYRGMIFNPKYGVLGIFVMPYFLLFETLGPFVELLGYIVIPTAYFLEIISFEFFLIFLFLAFLYGIFLSVGSIFLEDISYKRYPKLRQVFKLLFYAVLENFGYRQINTYWRCKSLIMYLFGYTRWQ